MRQPVILTGCQLPIFGAVNSCSVPMPICPTPKVVTGCQLSIFDRAPTCAPQITYFSEQQSGTCPGGTAGGPFVVPAGKFSSTISQAVADALASSYLAGLLTTCSGILNPFDYAVIRYSWTLADGSDLDTGTPFIDLDPLYNNQPVGWCWSIHQGHGPSVGPTNAPTNQPYLLWGGDNTGPSGFEAVLFNAKQIGIDYPALASLTINLTTEWYGVPIAGNFQIEFATYLGGTMNQVGTNFVNVGGILVDDIQVGRHSSTHDQTCTFRDQQGTLIYNFTTKMGTITNP